MGKRERDKKDIRRLQLRREVIRVLASDSLAAVHGGLGCGTTRTDGDDGDTRSVCYPSK